MSKNIPKSEFVNIGNLSTRYNTMIDDVSLLYQQGRFVSCTWLILSCLDTLASAAVSSNRGAFSRYVVDHFPVLDKELSAIQQNKSGGDLLYDRYRNGLAHAFGPKHGFALARNDELDGAFAGVVEVEELGPFIGLNVDRLATEFLEHVRQLAKAA